MKQVTRRLAVWLCAVVVGLALIWAGPVNSQIISGDVVGTIFDKSGGAVPGAKVVATNVGTGTQHETISSSQGEYRFSNLPVGTYSVAASAAGFATTTINGFKVELNKTSTLHITLEVTASTMSIEVTGGATTLDTTTSQLSSTFENEAAEVLPSATSGSGVLNLSLLSAGVGTSGGVGAGSGPTVGGQRPRNNNFTIEGVDNNSKSVTGPLVFVPNDAVSEFSLLQNNFSPEFGHSSGGQFNTVVRSGTNEFHGMAYIYNNNRNYNALDTLQALEGLGSGPNCGADGSSPSDCHSPGPRYDFNRIGGQVGGPVLKNKLFFFVNYEYQPYGAEGGGGAVCAPTTEGYDMISAYPNISQTNLSEFKQYVAPGTLSANCKPLSWADPNNPGGTISIPTAGLAVVAPNYSNQKILVTSADWDISSKDQLRGRYIWNNYEGIDTAANLPVFFTSIPNKNYLVTINEYHQFSTVLQNEFRIGYNRNSNGYPAGNFTFTGLDMFPNLQFADLGNLQLGPDPNAPQSGVQNTYQLSDAVSWTKGAHSLKFGIEGRNLIAPQTFTQRVRGDYEYASSLTYFQDLIPEQLAERSGGDTPYYGNQWALYWFVNDNWRIRPNLTLNLGVRYEYTTVPETEKLQSLNAIASVPGLVDFRAPKAAVNNWGPRIGLAYSPGGRGDTSIRAGFGIAYDILYDNLGLLSLPPELSTTTDCSPGQGGTANCPLPFLGGGGIPPGQGGTITYPDQATAAYNTAAYVPDVKSPKSINWTLGIQHSFKNDYTVEVRYLGTRGIHLPTQNRLNAASQTTSSVFLPTYINGTPDQATLDALPYRLGNPYVGTGIWGGAYGNGDGLVPAWEEGNFYGNYVTAFMPWASSTYNGLATQVTKKMSHGLQFVGSYTFSKTIDDATADVFSTVLAPRRPQNFQDLSNDRSNSILDHRHRFTLALVYDLTAFKDKNWFMKNVVSNWTIAPIFTVQTGQWVTAQNGIDTNLNGDSAPDRPVFNPNGVSGTGSGVYPLCDSGLPVADCTLANVTCFGIKAADASSCPGYGTTQAVDVASHVVGYAATNSSAQYVTAYYGAKSTAGRSTMSLNAINNWDITASKRLTITERFNVQFQAQAFNVFNHPQYIGGYLNDIGSASYTGSQRNMLLPTNSSFNKPQNVFSSNARTLQLALKFEF